jgi:cupredoxin-like protein
MPAARWAKLPLAMVSLALAWAVAGCSHTRRVGADRTLRVALSEYRLNPERAHAGAGMIAILVHNYGRLTHNLVVYENGETIGATKPVAPGQSAELDLDLAPGSYLMRSTILSDEALGEYGTLTIS